MVTVSRLRCEKSSPSPPVARSAPHGTAGRLWLGDVASPLAEQELDEIPCTLTCPEVATGWRQAGQVIPVLFRGSRRVTRRSYAAEINAVHRI